MTIARTLPHPSLVAFAAVVIAVFLNAVAVPAKAAEIAPFDTFNQSPLVQIYGLPSPGRATILGKGDMEARLSFDLANNFAHHLNGHEAVMLDGETLRSTLSLYRGFTANFEAGLELPIVSHSGGFLDGFIEGWHGFFGLPNGTRAQEPENRLLYFYKKNGGTRLQVSDSSTGIGDLRLTGATQLYSGGDTSLALRGLMKFPTGDSRDLAGSGSTDLALWLSADRHFDLGNWGEAALFGSLGGLAMTDGDVLRGQQRNFVGYGSLGAGWSPLEKLALKFQFSSHSPFYRGSDLVEVDAFSTMLVVGGTIAFSEKTALDIGVSEDVAIDRSPDTSFHLALSSRF